VRTKITTAPGDDNSPNNSLAAGALLPLALVDAVAQLEFSTLAGTINIVRYGRAAQADGFLKNGLDGTIEPAQFSFL
jgi:hypothetical protein